MKGCASGGPLDLVSVEMLAENVDVMSPGTENHNVGQLRRWGWPRNFGRKKGVTMVVL